MEGRYTTQPVHQGYIEPHACLATYAPDGQVSIHASSQGHFMIRAYTSKLLGIDIANIKVSPAENRRRFRRQDADLSGASSRSFVEKVRTFGQDTDDARGSVPRFRPDFRCKC